jgi:hypothetical protein
MVRARFLRLHVWCKARHHAADAEPALIDGRPGDVPLVKLRFRCAKCGSRRADAGVMASAIQRSPR